MTDRYEVGPDEPADIINGKRYSRRTPHGALEAAQVLLAQSGEMMDGLGPDCYLSSWFRIREWKEELERAGRVVIEDPDWPVATPDK